MPAPASTSTPYTTVCSPNAEAEAARGVYRSAAGDDGLTHLSLDEGGD